MLTKSTLGEKCARPIKSSIANSTAKNNMKDEVSGDRLFVRNTTKTMYFESRERLNTAIRMVKRAVT